MLAASCRIRVLPPNELFVYAGSFFRDLYILEKGYCEVSLDSNLKAVIGPLTPFAYIEMIKGMLKFCLQFQNVINVTYKLPIFIYK